MFFDLQKYPSLGRYHRNSVPVKEYGILYEYYDADDENKTNPETVYWIVG